MNVAHGSPGSHLFRIKLEGRAVIPHGVVVVILVGVSVASPTVNNGFFRVVQRAADGDGIVCDRSLIVLEFQPDIAAVDVRFSVFGIRGNRLVQIPQRSTVFILVLNLGDAPIGPGVREIRGKQTAVSKSRYKPS